MSYSAVLLRKTAGPTLPLLAFRYLRFACFSLFLWLKLFYKFRLCFGNNCSFNFTHAIPVKLRVYSLFFTLYIVFSLSVRFAYSVFNERHCSHFVRANAQSFASRNSRKTLPFKTTHHKWIIYQFHSSFGGLKWTRTTDLPLIRRAL